MTAWGPNTALAELTRASGGNRPPLAARLAYMTLPGIPEHIRRHPGSRAFRDAVNAALPEPWRLTRRDLAAAVAWLKLYNLLGEVNR